MIIERGDISELATLIASRMQDIASKKSQKEISEEVGFPTSNIISIIKKGATKLSLDRVIKMAQALDIDLATLMIPALRQYYNEEVIGAIRDTFNSAETETERTILAIARKSMNVNQGLSHETRERLAEVFSQNKPSGV